MILRRHTTAPGAGEASALARFEEEFSYPLGASERFRISHGDNYLGFFQAMGEAAVLAAWDGGEVLGCLAHVRRPLFFRGEADAEAESMSAHYLCDLKVRIAARGSAVLAKLMTETRRIIKGDSSHACYGIVMEGTSRRPTDYTGRLGVPIFHQLGRIAILRISGEGCFDNESILRPLAEGEFVELRDSLVRPGYRSSLGRSSLRSQLAPRFLATATGDACGLLEDTRLAKRLLVDGGRELVSAHLSGFSYATPEAGAALVRGAVALARKEGLPAVFLSLPMRLADEICHHLGGLAVTRAAATVYGHGLQEGQDWWVDTADI